MACARLQPHSLNGCLLPLPSTIPDTISQYYDLGQQCERTTIKIMHAVGACAIQQQL